MPRFVDLGSPGPSDRGQIKRKRPLPRGRGSGGRKKGRFHIEAPCHRIAIWHPPKKKIYFSRGFPELARLVGSGPVRMTSDPSFLIGLLGPLIDRDPSHRVVIASSSFRTSDLFASGGHVTRDIFFLLLLCTTPRCCTPHLSVLDSMIKMPPAAST